MEKPQFIVKKIGVNDTETVSKPKELGKSGVSKSVGVILISLLIVSILFGAVRRNQLVTLKSETEIKAEVEHKLREAQAIFLLNSTRSRELIVSARSTLVSSNLEGSEVIGDLTKKIEDAERRILGDYKKDLQLFFDLTLFSEGFSGSELFIEGNNLFVFDKNAKKVVGVNTESKRSEIIAGPQLIGEADQVMLLSGEVLYLNKAGVYETGGKKLLDQNFEGAVIAKLFTGNLYVLKPSESQIYRYPGTYDVFLDGASWISEEQDLDLSQAKKMIIDGFLWILASDGQITKLSQGKKLTFSIKGFDKDGFHASAIFTDETTEHLYLVDSNEGKMLVTGKDGEYKAQYSSEGLKEVSDFIVYEKIKKAFLLSSDKLLYLDLDHL